MKNIYKIGEELYITNDDDIKIEWAINIAHKLVVKPTDLQWADSNSDNLKNIILTTDWKLIKDGVQPIDDKFLEWIANNPNCEEVDIKSYKLHFGSTVYKIIYPKEDPTENKYLEALKLAKQIIFNNGCQLETKDLEIIDNAIQSLSASDKKIIPSIRNVNFNQSDNKPSN